MLSLFQLYFSIVTIIELNYALGIDEWTSNGNLTNFDRAFSFNPLTAIDKDTILEFFHSFRKLDHNHDGNVSLNEAAVGILSLKQRYDEGHTSASPSHLESKTFYDVLGDLSLQQTKQCESPVPDGPRFVDCVVSKSREIVKSRRSALESPVDIRNAQLDFLTEVSNYLYPTKCNDVMPSNIYDISCSNFVGVNHIQTVGRKTLMKEYLKQIDEPSQQSMDSRICDVLVSLGFCRLSCRACSPSAEKKDETTFLHGDDDNDESFLPVLITSDWHIEPWYDASITSTVARYPYPSIDNMWYCYNQSNAVNPVECDLNGVSDPPIDLIESHFVKYGDIIDSYNIEQKNDSFIPGLIFFSGDTQVHDFSDDSIGTCDESTAISDLMTRALSLITSYWNEKDVFLCPGNNDGPHNSIFSSSSDETIVQDSLSWGNAVVSAGIVNNQLGWMYNYSTNMSINKDSKLSQSDYTELSQIDFFLSTGYFVKQIDVDNNYGFRDANLYVIGYNTNLGSTNEAQQSALLNDLNRIANINGGVYLLGHHPEITNDLIPGEDVS